MGHAFVAFNDSSLNIATYTAWMQQNLHAALFTADLSIWQYHCPSVLADCRVWEVSWWRCCVLGCWCQPWCDQ